MAVMQNLSSHSKKVLMSNHLFGRDSTLVTTSLQGLTVSRVHASINWQNGHWFFSDFSKNGTMVNDKLILKSGLRINSGDVVKFGPDASNHWQITDDSPPMSYLISSADPDHIISLALNTKNRLPIPGFTIQHDHNTGWWLDEYGQRKTIQDGDAIHLSGVPWLFVENQVITETIDDLAALSTAYFRFDLSADEEHIRMSLFVRGVEMDLGERAHNYLCLSLARKRVADMEFGYQEPDQGWVNTEDLRKDLSRELQQDVDVYYLNLQVFRFRKHIRQSEPYGFVFSDVLERRKNEVRFGHSALVVAKEGKLVIDTRKGGYANGPADLTIDGRL